jgi:hypothetical protein
MTTYKTYKTTFGKSEWTVIVAAGKFNYVSVGKKTHVRVPYGKEFSSIEKAIENYKDVNLKLYLELIGMGLIIERSSFEA